MEPTAFNSGPIWEVLESAGINLISINNARQIEGLEMVVNDDEALLSGVMMLMARLGREQAASTLLAEEHDKLRVKYADVQEANRKIKDKLCHAAKKIASSNVQQLVTQMYAQPREEVLRSQPTGHQILKVVREAK